nr:MAG TPA_asm: hypothetical protein [Bacteriophage sp.]DAX95313.1 MAG TPA: hypothetical protein [Caudoviricetes sp.]
MDAELNCSTIKRRHFLRKHYIQTWKNFSGEMPSWNSLNKK